MYLTVVAAPIGLGLMELGKFLFLPFGKRMINKPNQNEENQNATWKAYSKIIMILYLPFGLIFAISGAIQAIVLFIPLITIPVALVVLKSLGVYLNPVNKICVSEIVAEEMERQQARDLINSQNEKGLNNG